ncbi:MAG: histone deacetylase [Chloroflexota bacterium]|nr:MAG: histone deacetylase [Chloroflexota bacterium]
MDDLVYFYPEGHEAHFERGHPERPERVEAIRSALQAAGWWDPYPRLEPVSLAPDVLKTVHNPAYVSLLEAVCRMDGHLDSDTYTTPDSWRLAHQAAGGAAAVASQVWQGKARRGFALCRPPGHHATPGQGMGFCLLNNIALAAEHLVQAETARKLAIVDLDLHHGNGTQDVFWNRGDVLFISTHQSPLYPGTGHLEETGEGPGLGTTANLPLPPGSGDAAFQAAMNEVILPLLDRFDPQMLLVSVGFDTHWLDPLGHLQLSSGVFMQLVASLASWADQHCQGRIALVLEGGYDLDAASACGLASVAALIGLPWQDPLGPSPVAEGSAWKNTIRRAKEIWGL